MVITADTGENFEVTVFYQFFGKNYRTAEFGRLNAMLSHREFELIIFVIG